MIDVKKKLGIHAGCGGEVWYFATATIGWTSCIKCRQTSLKGPAPETEDERLARDQITPTPP